jgi:hypothetical protein
MNDITLKIILIISSKGFMFLPSSAIMYLFSLLTLVISLIVYLTLGGVFQAYLRSYFLKIPIITEHEELWNPASYIELFVLVIFVFFGVLVSLRKQPFLEAGEGFFSDTKNFFKNIFLLLGGGFFHLVLASLFLFIGAWVWKAPFVLCAVKTSLKASSHFILAISKVFGATGPKLFAVTFLLVSVVLNLHIAVLDFIFSLLDFFLRKYLTNYLLDFKFLLLIYIFFLVFFIFFGNIIMYFFWKLISLPLYLL